MQPYRSSVADGPAKSSRCHAKLVRPLMPNGLQADKRVLKFAY
jgi:hypothetical protein